MHRNRWLLLVVALVAVRRSAQPVAAETTTTRPETRRARPTPARRRLEQVLRIAWGAEPPSLDPGKATDTTSSNVILALMDPLVKLNPDTRARAVAGR